MLNLSFSQQRKTIMQMGKTFLMAAAVTGFTQMTMAGQTVDQLSDCLMKSTTEADKTTVLQWTFVALSSHPDLQAFSQVSTDQKQQLDKNLAQVLQRIMIEQCAAETKAVIQTEGIEAVGNSFQELGRTTGDAILKNPEVKQQLKGVIRYLDVGKVATTFLSPSLLSNLGVFK